MGKRANFKIDLKCKGWLIKLKVKGTIEILNKTIGINNVII